MPAERAEPGGPYLEVPMPEWFSLEIDGPGGWLEWATCLADNFERLDDGSYVHAGHGGSPIWFRCLAHHDGYFEHIDGNGHGEVHHYRLVPIPLNSED